MGKKYPRIANKITLVILQKKINVLRALLEKLEKLPIDEQARFCDLIGGLCCFIENELDPELH